MIGLHIIQSNKFLRDVLVNSKWSLIGNKVKPSKYIRHNFLQTFSAHVNKETVCGKVGRKGKSRNETCLNVVGRSTEIPAGLLNVSPSAHQEADGMRIHCLVTLRVFHHFDCSIYLCIVHLFMCSWMCICIFVRVCSMYAGGCHISYRYSWKRLRTANVQTKVNCSGRSLCVLNHRAPGAFCWRQKGCSLSLALLCVS